MSWFMLGNLKIPTGKWLISGQGLALVSVNCLAAIRTLYPEVLLLLETWASNNRRKLYKLGLNKLKARQMPKRLDINTISLLRRILGPELPKNKSVVRTFLS